MDINELLFRNCPSRTNADKAIRLHRIDLHCDAAWFVVEGRNKNYTILYQGYESDFNGDAKKLLNHIYENVYNDWTD